MSIYFDFDVGPYGKRFRRAVDQDKREIETFINREVTNNIYGPVNIGSLIELSVLSICMINKNNEVLGFMSLDDHPNVYGLDPADWEIWMRNLYQKYYLSRDTLFIHCSCCKDSVVDTFMDEAITSVFMNDMYLKQIVLVATADSGVDNILRVKTLKQLKMNKHRSKRDDDSDEKTHLMFVAMRQDFCPKLKIRRAVEEDNDDVVQILDRSCPRLREMYGDFYISELIGRHPESEREIIVAQHNNRAVGVMCLNSDINYRKLQYIYELKPFFGLRKATPLEKEQHSRNNVLLKTYGEPIMIGKFSPFEDVPAFSHLIKDNKQLLKDDKDEDVNVAKNRVSIMEQGHIIPLHKSEPKVNFRKFHSSSIMEHIVYHTSDDFDKISYCSNKANSVDIILEDDPFDYEIVNIDTKLLNVPSQFSGDQEDVLYRGDNSESVVKICTSKFCVYKPKPKPKAEEDIEKNIKSKKYAVEPESNLYRGPPNAFSIELFSLHENIDPRSAYDMLEVAFEVMKGYDYCIIRVPSAEKSFPLLQHFCFVPMKPRICCNYSLYVAHRSAVMGKLRVREAEIMDIPLISRLLQTMQSKEIVCTIENCILGREESHAYVFMSGLSIVGIGILNVSENLNYLRTKYSMEPYHIHHYHTVGQSVNTGIANLKVAIVYPAFEVHYRFFMREMMRMSGSYSMVWMTAYRNKWVAYKANSLVSAMKPLIPRKLAMDLPTIPELKRLAAIEAKILTFSTWFLDKKLSSVPVMTVSTRIVLIGASSTAMGFINALIFDPANTYLCFTGVTLISTNGLPYLRHENEHVEKMFPKFHNNTDKYLKTVPYTYYVNIIQGTVNDINRQEQYVTLLNGNRFYYDLLFLLFGKQYQHPDYLEPEAVTEAEAPTTEAQGCKVSLRLDRPRKRIISDLMKYHSPDNVFIINNKTDALFALRYVKTTFMYEPNSSYIVYGTSIHAYCCLTTLLDMSIPAKNIVFVEPFPPEDKYKTRVSIFYNYNVDETIYQVIEKLGVTVYRSYYFKCWNHFDNIVTEVEFISHMSLIKLDCTAFFYYGKRGVDLRAYLAIHKCGMGYDGGILIDHQFKTVDPRIYAAGPCTAYFRRYYATDKKQKFYDSYEVGEKLGRQIRSELDPLFAEKHYEPRKVRTSPSPSTKPESKSSSCSRKSSQSSFVSDLEKPDKIPDFKKPRVTYCKLPGGLQYFEARSPGRKIPHHLMQSLDYTGYVMETFKGGYFKIHLSNDFIVDCIVCLTPATFDLEIFKNIYGKSSVVLNHVYLRYMTKKLDNLYDYFRSPWAFYLLHDQVDDLFAMVKELLPKNTNDRITIAEALKKVNMSNCSLSSSFNIKKELRDKFEASPYMEVISDYVIDWLSENDVIMPMYLQPSQVINFIHDLERTRFLKKKTTVTKLLSEIL